MQSELTIDVLAQEIRRVDGNHSLGAGALAEALMPFLAALSADQTQPVAESEWHRSDNSMGGVLLYTLREDGWRRGQPVMVNDVTVRIERCNGSDTDIEPIAHLVRSALVDVPAEPDDDEETYQIGKRDGYSEAVQQIDQLTGGDGEYRYCTDHDPDRHTPGPAEMIQRIVDRFVVLNLLDDASKTGRDQEWGRSREGEDTAEVTCRFSLEWVAGARTPVHPEPMRGRQSFRSFDEAIAFMRRQAADARFVSLTEYQEREFDRTIEACSALAATRSGSATAAKGTPAGRAALEERE